MLNKLDSNARGRLTLGVARTLLHEYIHADMFRKLNPPKETLDFKKTHNKFKNGNFKAKPQHETMVDLYVGELADALQAFHKKFLPRDYTYLSNSYNKGQPIPLSFYKALAWKGLKNHKVAAYTSLSDGKKQALEQVLQKFYHASTKNCPKS